MFYNEKQEELLESIVEFNNFCKEGDRNQDKYMLMETYTAYNLQCTELLQENVIKTMFQKIINFIKSMWAKIKSIFTSKDDGKSEDKNKKSIEEAKKGNKPIRIEYYGWKVDNFPNLTQDYNKVAQASESYIRNITDTSEKSETDFKNDLLVACFSDILGSDINITNCDEKISHKYNFILDLKMDNYSYTVNEFEQILTNFYDEYGKCKKLRREMDRVYSKTIKEIDDLSKEENTASLMKAKLNQYMLTKINLMFTSSKTAFSKTSSQYSIALGTSTGNDTRLNDDDDIDITPIIGDSNNKKNKKIKMPSSLKEMLETYENVSVKKPIKFKSYNQYFTEFKHFITTFEHIQTSINVRLNYHNYYDFTLGRFEIINLFNSIVESETQGDGIVELSSNISKSYKGVSKQTEISTMLKISQMAIKKDELLNRIDDVDFSSFNRKIDAMKNLLMKKIPDFVKESEGLEDYNRADFKKGIDMYTSIFKDMVHDWSVEYKDCVSELRKAINQFEKDAYEYSKQFVIEYAIEKGYEIEK